MEVSSTTKATISSTAQSTKTQESTKSSFSVESNKESNSSSKTSDECKKLSKDDKQIDEDNATLESYTKVNKPLSLEEAQKQKDEEQFDLAMKGHDMNPNSDMERFAFKLMQKGYRKEEAIERTNMYSRVGLVPREYQVIDDSQINYVGIVSHSAKFKESLEESFEQMSTAQLKKIAYDIPVGLPMEDIIADNPTHEEIMKRAGKYWDENGTIGKIVNMFNEQIEEVNIQQKFTTEDLSYIKDGFQLLIDTFKENYTQKGK